MLAPAGAALLLAGCGSSHRPRPKACKLKAQVRIARDLHVGTSAIDYAKSVGGNAMPQCAFTTRVGGHRVMVLVNIDNGPQVYFRLLRTVAEASQIFGPPPPGFHAPEGVSGLGPMASWFPNRQQLMATNRLDLLTVTVTWPGATREMKVNVARAAVLPYMPNPHHLGNANDYP